MGLFKVLRKIGNLYWLLFFLYIINKYFYELPDGLSDIVNLFDSWVYQELDETFHVILLLFFVIESAFILY